MIESKREKESERERVCRHVKERERERDCRRILHIVSGKEPSII